MGEVWVEIYSRPPPRNISQSPPVGEVWVEIKNPWSAQPKVYPSPPVGEVWVEIFDDYEKLAERQVASRGGGVG